MKYKTNDLPSEPRQSYTLPALTAGIQNQGLNNYIPIEGATILKNVISISANGANTGATFYQNKEFTVLQDAYAIRWIHSDKKLSDRNYLYIATAISKTIYGNFEWTNKAGWEKVKKEKITLPTKDGAIDFTFMEDFISEIEKQPLTALENYLTITELKDYTLTEEEKETLNSLDKVQWKEYKIVDIFNVKNTNNILSAWITPDSGEIPYLSASQNNNSVASYIEYNKDMIDKGNSIFIGGKTLVISYQEQDYFSNDSHNLALYIKDGKGGEKKKQLFMVACLYKSLKPLYTWGNSISNKKIQEDIVMLPTKNGTPDYDFMNTYIRAIHKVVIKEVVLYAEKKIQATKQVIK